MNYPLENLGAVRFQQLCQALLSKLFPNVQCFPVSEPDGGRDAILVSPNKTGANLVVYQVKFTKKALKDSTPHKSVADSLRSELPKINARIKDKATQYVLMTNVPGTGALDTGSIDVVQGLLEEHLSVPSQCWWRNDIERRLDDAWDIKWSFPEVLRNQDILRIILERSLTEDAARRTTAIRLFLREQYDDDTDVRFRQIDLQNKLLDLFIDVPINLDERPGIFNNTRQEVRALFEIARQYNTMSPRSEVQLGAASLLLNPIAQERLPWVVIEGAPGQGKSTIVQYVCQVHRQRLLNDGAIDSRMENEHQSAPLRLPFKIDCRDFSSWLGGKNPFLSEDQGQVDQTGYRSLETFLAAQVEYHSGGAKFSVSDLQAVLEKSPILIVFDGLDEVADIRERRRVVEEITKGTRRIRELSASLQCVITSRPTAFSNSPGLARNQFMYLQLGPINKKIISDYAKKWIKARGLKESEARSVRNILRVKLDQPHLRDLARNPMQLTILLSLIHRKGASLPDKRTALYDNYVSLFFDREAEKSEIVRKERELLIQIHRYLAWVLHSEAQTERTGGKVESARLKELVVGFLETGGHSVELAENLFSGVVDRVVALVSRIEGSYEFEVQPMREYFVARYLYDTAPYSPAGDVKRGTLPERFDALAQDFFWQNVTRFYAGCYSQGQLPSLLESLTALSKTSEYKNSCYPQSLANTLLSDYTFAQLPRIVDQVVDFVLDNRWFRVIMAVEHHAGRGESWYLPEGNGNARLVKKCFDELQKFPEKDYGQVLVEIIKANTNVEERKDRWFNVRKDVEGAELTQWISYGLSLGILQEIETAEIQSLIQDQSQYRKRLALFAFRGLWNYVSEDEEKVSTIVDIILDCNDELQFYRPEGQLERFAWALSSNKYSIAFREKHAISLAKIWERFLLGEDKEEEKSVSSGRSYSVLDKCQAFVDKSEELTQNRTTTVWASELEPWIDLSEHGRQLFGERWAFCVLANMAAAIRSKEAQCKEANDLFDKNIPIVRRARYARLRAGQWKWWKRCLDGASNELDVAFVLLLLFTWGGKTVVLNLSKEIDDKLCVLDEEWWMKVYGALENSLNPTKIKKAELSSAMSERMAVALSQRVNEKIKREIYGRHLSKYAGNDSIVLNYCQEMALESALFGEPAEWDKWLPRISAVYKKGARFLMPRQAWIFRARRHQYSLPTETAEKVIAEPDSYPVMLVRWAEQCCRINSAKQVMPVGKLASKNNWFGN